MESDSEGEEGEEEEEVVVEVEQRPSSLSFQDRITRRQLQHLQVSHIRLVLTFQVFQRRQRQCIWTLSVAFEAP